MVFGSHYNDDALRLSIDKTHIDYTKEWKYLGTTIVSGKQFSFTACPDLASFFRAANAVTSVLDGAHEHTLLTLVYSNCVPIRV